MAETIAYYESVTVHESVGIVLCRWITEKKEVKLTELITLTKFQSST